MFLLLIKANILQVFEADDAFMAIILYRIVLSFCVMIWSCVEGHYRWENKRLFKRGSRKHDSLIFFKMSCMCDLFESCIWLCGACDCTVIIFQFHASLGVKILVRFEKKNLKCSVFFWWNFCIYWLRTASINRPLFLLVDLKCLKNKFLFRHYLF